MFYRCMEMVSNFIFTTKEQLKTFHRVQKYNPFIRIMALAALPTYFYYQKIIKTSFLNQKTYKKQEYKLVNQGTWRKLNNMMSHIIRFLHLAFIFLPTILTYPLRLFKFTQKIWIKLFANSVQRAGVVWIKAFQYLSHRRDIIGAQMADNFVYLRQNAPQHSFEETKRNFRQTYGKNIEDIFQKFDPKPIASGSVSQVYKAIYKGRKVAVKVRHPNVHLYIQMDVNILFYASKFLSIFSKSFEIPISFDSLKKTLIDQINFTIEKDNLITFKKHFQNNRDVDVPQVFEKQSRQSILIQSFVEGVPITYFQQNRHPLNAVIARLGTYTFFQMLMKNNFVHADCHGGNFLVQVSKNPPSVIGEIKEFIEQIFHDVQWKITEHSIKSDKLRLLYKSSRQEQDKTRRMVRQSLEKVKITLIDAGMVIKLQQPDRTNFMNFLKSVVEGNSEKCASTIYGLSNFNGRKLSKGQFDDYKRQLKQCFNILQYSTIFEIQGMNLLLDMLSIVRDNHMKLDGQMATLLTNMVVIEAIARQIDPEIHLLKCAIPYFKLLEQNKIEPPFSKMQNYSSIIFPN